MRSRRLLLLLLLVLLPSIAAADGVPVRPGVDAWIASSGLTRRELAMIQPGYPRQRGPIAPQAEPPERIRQWVATRLNQATGDVQRCASAIGLETTGRVTITVDVARHGALTPRVAALGSADLEACIARVASKHLGEYRTRNRIAPARFEHDLPIFKAPGAPLDRERAARRVEDALRAACRDPRRAPITARFELSPSGAITLRSITGGPRADHARCARRALARVQLEGFRGRPTELEITVR